MVDSGIGISGIDRSEIGEIRDCGTVKIGDRGIDRSGSGDRGLGGRGLDVAGIGDWVIGDRGIGN